MDGQITEPEPDDDSDVILELDHGQEGQQEGQEIGKDDHGQEFGEMANDQVIERREGVANEEGGQGSEAKPEEMAHDGAKLQKRWPRMRQAKGLSQSRKSLPRMKMASQMRRPE